MNFSYCLFFRQIFSAIKSKILWYLGALGITALDQISKDIVLHYISPQDEICIIGRFFRLMVVYNSGAAFSFATDQTLLITFVSIVIAGVIAVYLSRSNHLIGRISLCLILGGALGNLFDRFFRAPGFLRGQVVDFISVGWWPVFNIADSAISIGVFLLFVGNIYQHMYRHTSQ